MITGILRGSDGATALEGAAEGDLVGVLQVSADGQPAGQPGDGEPHRLDHQREIGGRGLTLGIRVGGQDEFLHLTAGQPVTVTLGPGQQMVRR